MPFSPQKGKSNPNATLMTPKTGLWSVETSKNKTPNERKKSADIIKSDAVCEPFDSEEFSDDELKNTTTFSRIEDLSLPPTHSDLLKLPAFTTYREKKINLQPLVNQLEINELVQEEDECWSWDSLYFDVIKELSFPRK